MVGVGGDGVRVSGGDYGMTSSVERSLFGRFPLDL